MTQLQENVAGGIAIVAATCFIAGSILNIVINFNWVSIIILCSMVTLVALFFFAWLFGALEQK